MQALAWLGFVIGLGVLLITGSSVIKTLLIPRNLSSVIGTAVAASVLAVYRMVTARIHDDVTRRERIYASGAPTYLFALLVCWIICLYVAYTLMLLPTSRCGSPDRRCSPWASRIRPGRRPTASYSPPPSAGSA
jgi:small-conductance mechanosensitive channel